MAILFPFDLENLGEGPSTQKGYDFEVWKSSSYFAGHIEIEYNMLSLARKAIAALKQKYTAVIHSGSF